MTVRTSGEAHSAMTRFRWFVVVFLFAITIVNYIDRAAISFAIDPIAQELGLDNSQRGLILGAFGIGYMFTTFIGGVLVDRYGARIVLAVSVLLWAVSSALTAMTSSFFLLLVLRAVLGLSEGPMFPGMTGAVAVWLSPRERARALGLSLAAVPFALAIGGPIVQSWSAWSLIAWMIFGCWWPMLTLTSCDAKSR